MARIPSTAQRWQSSNSATRRCSSRADRGSRRSVSSLNHTASRVCDNLARMRCVPPPGKPVGPTFPQFGLCTEGRLPLYIKRQDFTWRLGRSLTRTITNGEVEDDQPPSTDIPVWSGYNSTMSSSMPLTRVGTPPLIAAPAHQWKTAYHFDASTEY